MYRHKIELVTLTDAINFVNAVSNIPGKVNLVDGKGFCVSGKSLLGAIASVEWGELYCESESDEIYSKIKDYCV